MVVTEGLMYLLTLCPVSQGQGTGAAITEAVKITFSLSRTTKLNNNLI